MNDRQKRFVDEYLRDGNATAAYIRAGYKSKGQAAEAHASRLVRNGKVAAAIAAKQKRRSNRLDITAENTLRELARIAFADPRKVVTWGAGGVVINESSGLSDDDAATVESISQTTTKDGGSIKVKFHSKPAALKLIADHLGMFQELPPLEILLARLRPDVADRLRGLLAGDLPPGPASEPEAK